MGLSAPAEYHREIYLGEKWLGRLYIDHWVNECVVVEDKAFNHPLGNDEVAQVIAYLAAVEAKVGLLLNFGQRRLEYRRVLPPKVLDGWQAHIAKYLWQPPGIIG
jgi:GxxExxY protein